MKYYLRLLSFPLLFFGFFLTLDIVWRLFNLPPDAVILNNLKQWFLEYGAIAVFFGAILEGMLLIGNYFPGVVVIFVGVVFSQSIGQAVFVISAGTLGLMIAHSFNYLLGKYGWYKLLVRFGLKSAIENSREKLMKKGPITIFSSYWMPSMASLIDTAAGIIHMPLKTFLLVSVISSIFWNTLVGAMVYALGDSALVLVSPSGGSLSIVGAITTIWIAILLIKDKLNRTKTD